MSSVKEDALLILRTLSEKSITFPTKAISLEEISVIVGLEKGDLDAADYFLLQTKYLEATGAGIAGTRRVTPQGIDYMNREMASRIPLSLDSERILRHIIQNEPPADYDGVNGIDLNVVEEALKLDHDTCVSAFQELEDEDLVRYPYNNASIMDWGAVSTPKGRQAVRSNFRREQSPIAHIGQIFNAPINATNVVNAINSRIEEIEQVGTQNEPEVILQAAKEILKHLADNVATNLELGFRVEFLQALNELQKELEKSDRDAPSIHQRIMSVLDFGDKLGGSLEFALKIAPFIPVLYEAAQKLLAR